VLDRIDLTRDGALGVPSAAELEGLGLPQTIRRVAPGLQAPQTIQSSLSFEQLLPGNLTFSVAGVSTRISQMLRSRNITAPRAGQARPHSDTVYQYESTGRFDQDQLIVGLNSRTSSTVTLFARYFLGRARSDTDGPGSFPADQHDPGADYGPAAVDARHRFTLGGSVRLPGNLRVSPLVIYSSPGPFNITTGRDNNADMLFTDRPAYATDPHAPGVVETPWGLLDPNPRPGQTIVPHNLGRGGSFLMVNLRVRQLIGFGTRRPAAVTEGGERRDGEGRGGRRGRDRGDQAAPGVDTRPPRVPREGGESRVTLSFSVAAQNVLNHVNPGPPIGNLSSLLFGKPVATAAPFGASAGASAAGNRRIELQARLEF